MNAMPIDFFGENETPQPDAQGQFSTPAEGAKFMAAFGVAQIPLRGKAPFFIDWPNKASTNPEIIDAWYAEYHCNFGSVATATIGGNFVFETDSQEVRKRFTKDTGHDFTKTLTIGSRKGGHRWFTATAESIALGNVPQDCVLGNDFSVRMSAQQCVSPGSIHPETGKQYRVAVNVPPVAPTLEELDWFKTQYVGKKEDTTTVKSATWMEDDILEGKRDNTLMRIGSSLRNKGFGEEEIYAVLSVKNEKQCKTKDGKPNPLDDADIRRISHSVARYKPGETTLLIGGVPKDGPDADNVVPPDPQAGEGVNLPWGEPAPFEPLLSPVPPFKIEYLPESFRPWAIDVAERMSIPLDYVGICMLCTFSAVIGRRAFVQPKEFDDSWKEALNLLGAVVAPSGGMKTPTWKIFTSEVTAIEVDWKRHHQAVMKVYDQEVAKYLESNKGKKKKDYTGVEPTPPDPRRRLVINDATPESAHTLMEKHPEGLLLYRDEIGGWLSDLDKPGRESAREMFLIAANGNDVHTQDRIGRGEVSAIMCLIFFGGMQPKIAQDLVNDERNAADGTIARLGLISYPNKAPSTTPLDRPVNEVAREYFRRALRVLAPMHEKDIYLKFSPAAQPIFKSWLENQMQRERLLTGPICSHFSKYKGLLPRLAAIYHLADAASAMSVKREAVKDDEVIVSSEISVAGFQTIAPEHLARAIAFLGEYLEPHMRRLYGCVKSPMQRSEAAFAEHVRAGDLNDGFTARDVKRKHWIGLADIGEIQYTLETFHEMGWIRPMPRPAGQDGRPTNKYEINPAVLTTGKEPNGRAEPVTE